MSRFFFSLIILTLGFGMRAAGTSSLMDMAPEKNLYLWGGAGDDSHTQNIFSDEFIQLDAMSKASSWNVTMLFDGNQPQEQQRVARAVDKWALRQFSEENFNRYLKDIQTKKFQKGDQVLFLINTHGSLTATVDGHNIVCSNDDDNCDTGQLKDIVTRLQGEGVEVAIMDLSCYSGQSLKMANDHTCVMSGASNDDVGFTDFDDALLQSIGKGKSLETIFLESREKDHLGRPRLSSPAGIAAEEAIKKLGGEAIVVVDLDTTNAAPQICHDCDDSELRKILNLSDEMLKQSAQPLQSAKAYMAATEKYRKLYLQVREIAKKIKLYEKKTETVDDKEYSWVDLAEVTRGDGGTAYKKKLKLQKQNADFRRLETLLKSFQQATNSDVDDKRHLSKLARAALDAQKYENQLYLDLYKSYQGHEENPCAKFIF